MAESATLNTANICRQSRITVFGDSISKGLYLENGRICRVGRSAVTILTERYGVGADNFSAYGQTLKKCWEKGHFERFLRETPPGSVLAVALGGNDCDYRWEDVAEAPLAAHAPNTPLPEFGEILRKVIALLRAHGRTPLFFSLPPIDSQRYFRNVISARADGERVMEFFRGDVTNIARHQEAYNLAVMKAALENGCPFIDFRTDMLLMPDYLACLSDDGIHPNARGHEEIARIVGGKLPPSETAERLPVSPAAHGGQAAERSKAT